MPDNEAVLAKVAARLASIASAGLASAPDEYDHARYIKIQRLANELQQMTTTQAIVPIHSGRLEVITPFMGVDAAIFDETGRILLIQRADNQLWAMPGGGADVGETAAECAVREAWEETGLQVRPLRLLGVYNSRQVGSIAPRHIYHFTFECGVIGGELHTTNETLAYGYFGEDALPPLSGGHNKRVPDAFLRWREGGATFH